MMNGQAPRAPDAPTLVAFIDTLRKAGYNIGMAQYVAAQELLYAQQMQEEPPDDPIRQFKYRLGPLLCNSPTEQADFARRYDAFWNVAVEGTSEDDADVAKTFWQRLQQLFRPNSRTPRFWLNMLVAVLVLVAFVFVFSLTSAIPSTKTHPATGEPTTSVPQQSAVPTQAATEETSTAVLQLTSPVIPDPTHEPLPVPTGQGAMPKTPTTPPLAQQAAEYGWMIVAFVVAVLCLVIILWRVLAQSGWFLQRQATSRQPETRNIPLDIGNNHLFPFPAVTLAHMARKLRRRVKLPASELDISRTIEATIQQAGWLTPVYAQRQVLPEYLLLVDRASRQDHQAQFVDAVIDQLRRYEVRYTVYSFDADPRLCFPPHGNEPPARLRELAHRYHDHRLIIFSDANRLFSLTSGQLEAWSEQFIAWSERAIMTPVPVAQWGYQEQELQQAFLLLPTTEEGLTLLPENLTRADPTVLPPEHMAATLPAELRLRPLYWTSRNPPDTEQIDRMLTALQHYLDDASYFWLSACAVYPSLDWKLTCYLGETLHDTEGQPLLNPSRLLALARLPWLREGYLPDWLRQRLISDMPDEQQKKVRAVLNDLQPPAETGKPADFSLKVVHEARRFVQKQVARLRGWVVGVPKESPLQDHIYLRFMYQRKPQPLLHPVTEWWSEWLKGQDAVAENTPATQEPPWYHKLLGKRDDVQAAAPGEAEPLPLSWHKRIAGWIANAFKGEPDTLDEKIGALVDEVDEEWRKKLQHTLSLLRSKEKPDDEEDFAAIFLSLTGVIEGETGLVHAIAKQQNYTLKNKNSLNNQIDELTAQAKKSAGSFVFPLEIASDLHWLRVRMNKARHNDPGDGLVIDKRTTEKGIDFVLDLLKWYYCQFEKDPKLSTIYGRDFEKLNIALVMVFASGLLPVFLVLSREIAVLYDVIVNFYWAVVALIFGVMRRFGKILKIGSKRYLYPLVPLSLASVVGGGAATLDVLGVAALAPLPDPMTGDVNIAIARDFGDDVEMAKNVYEGLNENIQRLSTEDQEVQFIQTRKVNDEQQALDDLRKLQAHMIIWGKRQADGSVKLNFVTQYPHEVLEIVEGFETTTVGTEEEAKKIVALTSNLLTGLVYLFTDHPEDASKVFVEVLKNTSDDHEIADTLYFFKGRAFDALYEKASDQQERENLWNEAMEAYSKTLRLNPQYSWAYVGQGKLYHKPPIDYSRRMSPTDIEVYTASLTTAEQKFQEAITHQEEAPFDQLPSTKAYVTAKAQAAIGTVYYTRASLSKNMDNDQDFETHTATAIDWYTKAITTYQGSYDVPERYPARAVLHRGKMHEWRGMPFATDGEYDVEELKLALADYEWSIELVQQDERENDHAIHQVMAEAKDHAARLHLELAGLLEEGVIGSADLEQNAEEHAAKAREYLQDTIALHKEQDDTSQLSIARLYLAQGKAATLQNDSDAAVDAYTQMETALDTLDSGTQPFSDSIGLRIAGFSAWGELLYEQEKMEESIAPLTEAIQSHNDYFDLVEARSQDAHYDAARAYYVRGQAYAQQRNMADAYSDYDNCTTLAAQYAPSAPKVKELEVLCTQKLEALPPSLPPET